MEVDEKGEADVRPAGRTASRGRGTLRASASKVSVTESLSFGKEISSPLLYRILALS